MKAKAITLLICASLLVVCGASSTADKRGSAASKRIGAGFRFSTYGVRRELSAEYWASVGKRMASKFPGAKPQAIWIVGNYSGTGTTLTFPGAHANPNIRFSGQDRNEAALALFDRLGFQVWLQVEPGDAPIEELIRILLKRYGKHRSVIGVGIDVEWFHARGKPEGRAVTDEEAAAWVKAVRSHNPRYRLFLKHWEPEKMPLTYRDGILFVDDSQQFASVEHLVNEFAQWGKVFSPARVAFQYGYPADEKWWKTFSDPPGDIGRKILGSVPNTEALFWVDFSVLKVFPESGSRN